MDYKSMIENARKTGGWSEKIMLDSVDSIAGLLECVKKANKDAYWRFIREQYGIMNNCHYADKEFADWDVSQIAYTDKEGKKHTGAYWTCEQVEEATKAMSFPSGTTKYDKFVAFNLAKSDFCKKFDDAQILQIGYLFFFADEDWDADGKGSATKVWDYVACKNGL
jgi:hypothetical protein